MVEPQHQSPQPFLRSRGLALLIAFAVSLGVAAGTLQAAAPKKKRARLPRFPQSVGDAFLPDASQKLVGTRPAAGAAKAVATPQPTPPASAAGGAPAASDGWSNLIAAEAVEDEIKSRQVLLLKAVQNATRFKSGENQQARTELGVLATMLAIVAEYDGRIRCRERPRLSEIWWPDPALTARLPAMPPTRKRPAVPRICKPSSAANRFLC